MICTKQPFKLLVAIPTPFDFKLVQKYQDYIKEDKLIPKYYPEIEAYIIIRDFFLKNKQYTHLALACSDIVISQCAIDELKKDIEKYDFPIISGMMNLALEHMSVYNITRNPVFPENPVYDWYVKGDKMEDIQQVWFSGFPLMIIRRDVIEEIPFEKTSDLLGIEKEINCLDISFCWRCWKKDIPIHADTRVNLLHLKELNDESQKTLVGKVRPFIEYHHDDKLILYN